MAIKLYEEQSPYENDDAEQAKRTTKRLRWATKRANNEQGLQKRQSILNRWHKKSPSGAIPPADGPEGDKPDVTDGSGEEAAQGRTIYFNMPLPDSSKDEEGHPIMVYPRNKIRTAKYTPLSFLPKNLWFQFHNIANIYFLFIIILCVSIHTKPSNDDLLTRL